MDYAKAYDLSRHFLKLLTPVGTRIEPVGSIKRADPNTHIKGVHDIEFLIIPDPSRIPPVFGAGRDQPKNKLEQLIADLRADGVIADPDRKANGERYKKFAIVGAEQDSREVEERIAENAGAMSKEFCLELFIVTPRTWAIQNVIRTGPSAFSQRFVTSENSVCFHKPTGNEVGKNAGRQLLDEPT